MATRVLPLLSSPPLTYQLASSLHPPATPSGSAAFLLPPLKCASNTHPDQVSTTLLSNTGTAEVTLPGPSEHREERPRQALSALPPGPTSAFSLPSLQLEAPFKEPGQPPTRLTSWGLCSGPLQSISRGPCPLSAPALPRPRPSDANIPTPLQLEGLQKGAPEVRVSGWFFSGRLAMWEGEPPRTAPTSRARVPTPFLPRPSLALGVPLPLVGRRLGAIGTTGSSGRLPPPPTPDSSRARSQRGRRCPSRG